VISVAGLVLGLALLALASEWFVVGAARVATSLRISAVIVGAVVVGVGTSAPEVLVTVLASSGGDPDLAVGNVVGSNLANLTLVLGVAALTARVVVDSGTLRREAPLSTIAVCLFAVALWFGLGPVAGAALLVALIIALAVVVRAARTSRNVDESELIGEVIELEDDPAPSLGRGVVRALAGLAGTLVGAQLVVAGAVSVAGSAGLSEGFVGLTIVAIGTSLPELVTAVQAARHGEDDLVIGNVLGSNLFNSLAAGGLIGLLSGGVTIEGRMWWSVALMVFTAVSVGALMRWRRSIGRSEAAVLLVAYVVVVPLIGVG
jgi:cation:H+ antiporter